MITFKYINLLQLFISILVTQKMKTHYCEHNFIKKIKIQDDEQAPYIFDRKVKARKCTSTIVSETKLLIFPFTTTCLKMDFPS